MLLGSNNNARFLCGVNDYISVDRLNCSHIDNSCGNALCLEAFGSHQSLVYHKTRSDNCSVCTLNKYIALTDFKFVAFVKYSRHCKTTEAHINRSVMLNSSQNAGSCFNIVGRIQNNHTGNCSHKSNILTALVACAVLADRNSCVSCADFNVQVRIAD